MSLALRFVGGAECGYPDGRTAGAPWAAGCLGQVCALDICPGAGLVPDWGVYHIALVVSVGDGICRSRAGGWMLRGLAFVDVVWIPGTDGAACRGLAEGVPACTGPVTPDEPVVVVKPLLPLTLRASTSGLLCVRAGVPGGETS